MTDLHLALGLLADPAQRVAVEKEIPLGRWGAVDDVARAVAWLASREAEYVTGNGHCSSTVT